MTSFSPWRHALGLAVAFALMAGAGLAAEGTGADPEFYVNTYSSIGTVKTNGTRSRAMGGSGRGLADGASSIGVNPAALGALTDKAVDVGLGYDSLHDGDDGAGQVTFRVGGAVSLEKLRPTGRYNQAVGGVFQTDGFSGAGGDIGMKKNQTSFTGAYGLHLMENLLVGASVSVFSGRMKSDLTADNTLNLDRSSVGGEFRLGALYRVSDNTTLGGTAGYSTGSYKEKAAYANGANAGNLNRWNLGFGIAHQLCEQTLVLGDAWYDSLKTDVPGIVDEHNKSWGVSAGIEQQVIEDLLALRGGLYYAKNSYGSGGSVDLIEGGSFSKGRFGFTAGAGLKIYSFDLGYSLDVNTAGSVSNQVDFSTEW